MLRASFSLFALAAAVAVTVTLTGCRSGSYENENDRLRGQVLDLEDDAADLRHRVGELEAQLAAANAVPEDVDPAVRANTPRVATLEISRLSHVRWDEADPTAATLVLYVEPADGRGRFLQVAGRLAVNVAVLPAGGAARTIGSAALGPAELRAAYRSGFTGTHYTVEIPIEIPNDIDPGVDTCEVRAVYTDGWTGQERAATASVVVRASRLH